MNNNDNQIHMLLKFGAKEHMEMLQKGKMFFGTRKFYNGIANSGNENIGDIYEGVFPNKNCNVKLIDPETKILVYEGTGTLIQSDERVDKIPFFSCTYISDSFIDEEENVVFDEQFKNCFVSEKNWEYVLLIDAGKFLKRIRERLQGINVLARKVKYADYEYLTVERDREIMTNIKNILLWKDIKYSFQKEFRIILENKDFGDSVNGIMDIGDISDISFILKKEVFFRMDMKIRKN